MNSKNCEFIQVLIRRSGDNEKSSLRKLTILKQDTEKIAILDLNENDKLNDFSNPKNCRSFKKHWSVCLKAHQSDPALFEHLDISEIDSFFHNRTATGNHGNHFKRVKPKKDLKNLDDSTQKARKISKRLSKRASHFKYSNVSRQNLLKSNSTSNDLNRSKPSSNLTKSQFLLINCDFKDSVSHRSVPDASICKRPANHFSFQESSQCRMIKLIKKGCFKFTNGSSL